MASTPHPSRTPSVRRSRRFVAVPVALLAAGLTVTVLATPATADPTPSPSSSAAPTVASVTAQLTDLSRQNEALAEKSNAATIDLTAKQAAATKAAAAAAAAKAAFQTALQQYGATIVEQYQNGQLSKAGALLSSSSTQNYLDTVSNLDTISAHNNAEVGKLSQAKAAATASETAATSAVTAATKVKDDLAAQQKTLQTRTAEYKTLLASLTPVQQTAYTGADNAPASAASLTVHAGSAAAQTAIDFALSQRGKPYVYGASGPNAYDCSGLTAAAYAAAGVSLPHSAAGQYGYGTHVSVADLQPGDLVFFYSPISHVGIYLGNGLMVHAPTSGDVVKVSPMFSGAVGGTRLT